MKPIELIENFETIVEAPGGVQLLRELVLDLAVKGKLVPQDSSDGLASKLLEIEEAPTSLQLAEQPHQLPTNWTWARFQDVAETRLGKMLDKARNTGPLRPYLRNANVQWFRFALDDVSELQLEDKDYETYSLRVGDLVLCEGGEPGRAAVCDSSVEGMVFQKALHRARPRQGINVWYLAYVMRWYAIDDRLAPYFTGATIKHLTGQSLASVPIPLPPADEQDRVVNQVDALMDQCDTLELRLATRSERRLAAARSLIRDASRPA